MLAFFIARYLYNLHWDHLATPQRKITEADDFIFIEYEFIPVGRVAQSV